MAWTDEDRLSSVVEYAFLQARFFVFLRFRVGVFGLELGLEVGFVQHQHGLD